MAASVSLFPFSQVRTSNVQQREEKVVSVPPIALVFALTSYDMFKAFASAKIASLNPQ